MNIFALDKDPVEAAKQMCDRHITKMPVESAQMLSTAHRVLDGTMIEIKNSRGHRRKYYTHEQLEHVLYKPSHVNHPCNIWLRESVENYNWLYAHFVELARQFETRYYKEHLSFLKLADVLKSAPSNIPDKPITPHALAMPDYCKVGDVVESYRNYYKNEKHSIAVWKLNNTPDWW